MADNLTRHQLDVWKTTVEVQQHFNDIGLRIRGLALTVLTASLGGAALAIREGNRIYAFGLHMQLGSAVLMAGLIVWIAFYFVDQVWYHRLLMGAVRHGEELEKLLEAEVPGIGLTKAISTASPYEIKFGIGKRRTFVLHARHKLSLFYWVIAALLLLLALGVQVGGGSATSGREKPPNVPSTEVPTPSLAPEVTSTTAP